MCIRRTAWRWAAFVVVVTCAPGCIIGTWPTPEERPDPVDRGKDPTGPEICDDIDNDGDGSIDESCACETGSVRACVGVDEDEDRCGLGLQYCEGAIWKECADIDVPFSAAREPEIRVLSIEPDPVVRGETTAVTVVVEPIPACNTITVPAVSVVLEASQPLMRVRATGRDDGQGGDAEAGDGLFTARLANPFGPGVGPQTLTVRGQATMDSRDIEGFGAVEMEDAP